MKEASLNFVWDNTIALNYRLAKLYEVVFGVKLYPSRSHGWYYLEGKKRHYIKYSAIKKALTDRGCIRGL